MALEISIPHGAVPLESVLYSEELHTRLCRPPDQKKENRALVVLTSALAKSCHTILQTLADTILHVTESDSSGISLLITDDGGMRFYWPAIAGKWKPHIGGGTPRHFGPCGDVLDRNCTLLFKHFERRYTYLQPIVPSAEECLLVPFYVAGKAVGTIWAIMHSDRRRFDAEDERLMKVLGQFASVAYHILASTETFRLEMAACAKTETELRQLTTSLAGQVRARTEELEQRNKELAETRAQLAEEKRNLEHREAYLVEAQRLSHTGSWYWNARTGEIAWSQEAFAIFGFDPAQTKPSSSSYLDRIHPEDLSKVQEIRRAAISEKRDYDAEYRIVLPGGLIKSLHSIGHCLDNQSGDVEYLGAIVDITEHKRAVEEHERLRQAQADLARMNRISTMGELAASLAHEIKQPISAALINARTCLRWVARDQPDLCEARKAASRLIKDVTRASEIISQIGSMFKKDVFQREWVDINELIREMIVLLRSEAARYSIWIHGDLPNDLPEVMADRVQLQQVLMNLMLNGIEAMKGLSTRGRLTITSQEGADGQLLVSVSDTGVGLKAGQAERIFTAFFTSKSQGIGMGLPISRSIIESHGGRLWATCNSGPGAAFHFTLPVDNTASQAA